MINWVKNHPAGVKCLQEYFYDYYNPIFKTKEAISKNGAYHCYYESNKDTSRFQVRGLAIFSKYPIINSGRIFADQNQYNRGIFADILYNDDTVRIVNIHLHSMEMGGETHLKGFYFKYKTGTYTRVRQGKKVLNFVKNSPYMTIVCGDFNQTALSYLYKIFDQQLHNAFDKAGSGFGFTLNNKLFFLRIDNQFYNDKLKIKGFKTLDHIKYSEHYPILGLYQPQTTD